MAAGKHGGYRDNEFRDRESDLDVTRRRNFYYSKEEYYRYNYGHGREIERSKERDGKDRYRLRQKDNIKEREIVINGGYHLSSNRSNSGNTDGGHRHGGVSDRTVDREPGELSSSGSGSDGAIASEAQAKDKEVLKSEDEVRSPPGKKRKFSPIVWDREKEERDFSKNRVAPTDSTLSPSQTLPKSLCQSTNIVPYLVGSAVTELSVGLSSSLPVERCWSNDQEPEHLQEEEFVPTRNISASRWADKDDGAVSDDEDERKRRKKMLAFRSLDTRLDTKVLRPELGELTREDLGGTRVKSSESDEGSHCVRSASEVEFPDNELVKNDYMEIDKEDENNNGTVHQSDTDSEGENDSWRPQRSLNMLQGCRSVFEFENLNKIDEGTYGVVFRARDKRTGEIVALKKVKMEKEREGFPLTALREINILLSSHHPSIVDVKEVVIGKNLNDVYMVMEYMEHDLKGLMETMKQPFSQSEVKCLMLQLLEGVQYLHDNWVLHRDLKTSNLLLNNQGELKICDFGLSRQYGSPLKPYTQLVVTLWYRAPELLLGAKQYSTAIDMWSLGCIMAELLAKEALFSGKTELDQLDKIFRTIGTPNETIWPGFSKLPGVKLNFVKHKYNLLRKKFPPTSFTGSPILSDAGFDLLNRLLTYDPEKRITAQEAANHEWFREVPLPKSKDFMPTFPAQHAQDRRRRRTIMKSPDPLEEQRIKELQQGKLGTGGLFG